MGRPRINSGKTNLIEIRCKPKTQENWKQMRVKFKNSEEALCFLMESYEKFEELIKKPAVGMGRLY